VLRSDEHPNREYAVQYGEADATFSLRLLADEGIASYYAFAQGGALTLADDTSKDTALIEDPFPYLPPSGMPPNVPYVQYFEPQIAVEPTVARIRDYDYENPAFIIEGNSSYSDDDDADLEH
jgi:uncharacterized protein involved in type VI secretion and phage assembly